MTIKMKSILLLISLVSFIAFAKAAENTNVVDLRISQTQPTTYTCVMHPEIHATKPGKCPKCGMTLIKEKPKKTIKQTPAKPVKASKPVVPNQNSAASNNDIPKK